MACFVFKTEALKSEGGFEYLPVAWHSDDASSLKVCKNGIANSSQILFNFRTSSVNISGRKITSKDALEKAKATLLYDEFNNKLRDKGIEVGTGIFGADMKVSLINDGPVTILLEK